MSFVAIVLAAALCQDLQPVPATSGNVADDRAKGLQSAVGNLEAQIEELSKASGRTPHLRATQSSNQEENVVTLGDAMVDHALLTRTYLALGIAELKTVSSGELNSLLSSQQRDDYLRHAEAIAIAIDARVLEYADLRVHRALQAGINQALRKEIALASGNGVSSSGSSSTGSSQSCCCVVVVSNKCRLFRKHR